MREHSTVKKYDRTAGGELIKALESDPENFAFVYQLYEEYVKGFDIETLRPLLRSKNESVRFKAAAVLEEGANLWAEDFRSETDMLLWDINVGTAVFALQTVACRGGGEDILLLLKAMEGGSSELSCEAMTLLSFRSGVDLKHDLEFLVKQGDGRYIECIRLLYKRDEAEEEEIAAFLESPCPLKRKFGCIAAAKLYGKSPRLLERAAELEDGDAREFSAETLRRKKAALKRERKKRKKGKSV
ncbi:MAG: hypothetical protein NC078_12240 [Ruminococcus sp.]|nr:hypothetical protein [Ruminococcus sp.]